jgi:hypothetical protein
MQHEAEVAVENGIEVVVIVAVHQSQQMIESMTLEQ